MVIHPPSVMTADGETCVSAEFELARRDVRVPDTLWFRFPERYGRASSGRADGFAAALMLLAMRYGEDMEVRGTLSPRLAFGMQEYQRLFHFWLPHHFSCVSIRPERYGVPEAARGTGCAFSGGVDSFYTLRSHLPQGETVDGIALSHALFIHGYDIPLADERTYRAVAANYGGMMRAHRIELVTARTNVHEVLSPTVGWEWAHGAALIAVALTLDRCFERFYVPASHTYADAYPWGSDSRLDHLLSTETLEVVHDGASASRVEKAARLAEWPETYERLRVCWENPDGLNNCGRCRKCIRTMIILEALGVLTRYRTFRGRLTGGDIRTCRFVHPHERRLARQAMADAAARGRRDLALNIQYALIRSRIKCWLGHAAAVAARVRAVPRRQKSRARAAASEVPGGRDRSPV